MFRFFFFRFSRHFSYRGPVVRRDWDRIAQRRAALRAAKSPEDRAELRKQFRLEDAMAGDAQATSDPLFMPRTKSSKQQKIVVQPTDAFGLGAFVGGGGENLPQQQQQQVAADASPAKAKSATNAKKMQREQEERRQRLQMEQEKLLREQAVEIPTVLSNAPPPSRLTDARALFRAIMTRKIPILSGADVDERLNGFNIDLDDANWANHKSLRAAQPADASEGAGEQRVSLPTNDEHVDEAAASADGEGDASSSSSSSSSRSRSLIGATAASVAPLPNEQSDSDDELVDDDDDDEPTMELPRGPSMSMATLGDDGDCCPLPTFTQTQVELTAEATLAIADADGGDEDDDADEDEEEAVTQAAKSRSLKKRAADDDDESSSAAMHAAAMLDNEADEASGDESSGGDDDDDDGAELIVEDGADAAVASDQAGLHAQLTFEQDYVASFGGGDDDESDGRKRKRGGVQRSDDAEDDGSRVVRRRRRGGSDAAASSDDDDGNDDVDHNATAVRPPSMQLRDDDGGDDVASVVGDRHQQHQQHDDESEEVDDATKQRIRERVQARAAKNDFFAAHGDGLGRSQSNSLFPISDDHSQHALARVVLLNESSQSMVVAPPRSRALLRSSSFLVPLDIDLQQSGRTSAGPIESLFSKVVGRTGAMAPPSARPAATTTATATATTGQKADTPRSPMSRSKSMTDVAAVGTMRRSFSAVNPQRLRELTASHNRVVQNTSSRSVLFASDSQDGRTQPGNAPSTVSSSGGSQQPVSSFFSQLMHKSK
jgi:hypothetical protein